MIEKEYEMNVGKERFRMDDKEFFMSLDFKENDIFYTNFVSKWWILEEAGIPIERMLFTFLYFYPGIDSYKDQFDGIQKSLGIIFRSKRARMIFLDKFDFPESLSYIMRPFHNEWLKRGIRYSDRNPTVLLPSRMDHEDHNHSWEALSLLLALKNEIDFHLVVSNGNRSADLGVFKDVIDEIGPLSRARFEEIVDNHVGVIFSKKSCDYDGSKGAPEYLVSNLLFVSYDYDINPYDISSNDNSVAYSLIKKYLTCSKETYIRAKEKQKDTARRYHGQEQIKKIFGEIFDRRKE